jgi:hypothetical protein
MLQHEAGEGSVSASSAPQVRRRAAERLIMTADQAAQMLVRMMEDTKAPFGVRAKIAQDLLDRAGLWLRRSTRSSRRRRTRSCGSSRGCSATRATGWRTRHPARLSQPSRSE